MESNRVINPKNMIDRISSIDRIKLIRNQLNSSKAQTHISNSSNMYNPLDEYKLKHTFNPLSFQKFYFPFENQYEFRNKIFNLMKNIPEFNVQHYQSELNSQQLQEILPKQMEQIIDSLNKNIMSYSDLRKDSIKFGIFMQCTVCYNASISVRLTFHSILYHNSLLYLGTENHSEYIKRCNKLEDIGCFALTELGHGSNVRCIKTTAHYDSNKEEFVLNTPSVDAYKWWIGGAGKTANMAIVFAQLFTKGECKGVHAFLVKIRKGNGEYNGQVMDGIKIGETGPKAGSHAVDNGYIAFDNYRVPREALLNKISQVERDGTFRSSIKSDDVRFATALGALSEGRIGVCMSTQVSIYYNELMIYVDA